MVTGGAGYIGSHTVRHLLKSGYRVTILDNLSRGHKESVPPGVSFLHVCLLNKPALHDALQDLKIDAVIHFAAFAYIGESVEKPLLYYENNVVGSYNLISVLVDLGIDKIVFSSTCSIYGNSEKLPVEESAPSAPINPYAYSKLMIEQMLHDADRAHGMKAICLRYFNAAGASYEWEIGESHDPEPHLIPSILFAALGKKPFVPVLGDDYPTLDGSCVRDFTHVDDLALAHIRALAYLLEGNDSTLINLGTGSGNSVLEVIKAAERITGRSIPCKIHPRRIGDPAILVAENKKAARVLGWSPRYGLTEMLESAWKWMLNPKY